MTTLEIKDLSRHDTLGDAAKTAIKGGFLIPTLRWIARGRVLQVGYHVARNVYYNHQKGKLEEKIAAHHRMRRMKLR